MLYHLVALLFYFAAFVLEAATTAANGGAHIKLLPNSTETLMCITYPRGNVFTVLDQRQFSINVAATVRAASAASTDPTFNAALGLRQRGLCDSVLGTETERG